MAMQPTQQFDPTEHLIRVTGGAEYLEVKWRLVWFRSEHPNGQIMTEVQEHDRETGYARVKARVQFDYTAEDGSVRSAVAESTGTEIVSDFPDYLEKAETKAIGRALAALGYGTQFANDFDMQNDDGSPHVVDAPVQQNGKRGTRSGTARRNTASANTGRGGGGPETGSVTASRRSEPAQATSIECENCGQELTATAPKGNRKGMTAQEKADFSVRRTGRVLCYDCFQDATANHPV